MDHEAPRRAADLPVPPPPDEGFVGSHHASAMIPPRLSRIASTDAREQMAELVSAVAFGGARIILQRHGRDVAAIVSIEDLRKLGVRLGREIPAWPGSRDRVT